MSMFDYMINICEAFTTAYIAVNYATIKENISKKLAFLLIAVVSFGFVTFFNLVMGYESYYLIVVSIAQFICLYIVSENTLIENLIEILLLSLILSFANATFILIVLIFTNYEIYMLYQPPIFNIFCIFARIFHFMWGIILVKFQKKIGYMITEYNKIFLVLLFAINFGTISVENIMMGDNGINSIYAFYAEICFILEIIIILYFMYAARKKYLIDLEKDKLFHIQNTVEDQIKQFKQDQDRISSLRHDMKNKFLILDAMLNQNKIEEVKAEIVHDLEYIESLKAPVLSGNPSIDLLINSKILKCKDQNIPFNIQIEKSAVADIDDVSYGILLGNALDNAIEHNRRENPFVELSIMKVQNQVKIEIVNSIEQFQIQSYETVKEKNQNMGLE